MLAVRSNTPSHLARSGRSFSRHFLTLILLVLLMGVSHGAASDSNPDHFYPDVFRFGIVNLLDGVNHKDAQVAIEMNFGRHNRVKFRDIKPKLEIIRDIQSVAGLLQQKQLHCISLSGVDYLALKERVAIQPLFVSSRHNQPLESYLLIVAKGIESLDHLLSLPQRRLVMENIGETQIGQLWIDTLLWEQQKVESNLFFTSIRRANKPARIVLPVFFGQAEACLVPESAYATMIELNPQISQRLKVLKRSPEFVRTITCAVENLAPDLVDAVVLNAIDMAGTVNGQQLMLIFQYKQHFLYRPSYMQKTKGIYDLYHKKMAEK